MILWSKKTFSTIRLESRLEDKERWFIPPAPSRRWGADKNTKLYQGFTDSVPWVKVGLGFVQHLLSLIAIVAASAYKPETEWMSFEEGWICIYMYTYVCIYVEHWFYVVFWDALNEPECVNGWCLIFMKFPFRKWLCVWEVVLIAASPISHGEYAYIRLVVCNLQHLMNTFQRIVEDTSKSWLRLFQMVLELVSEEEMNHLIFSTYYCVLSVWLFFLLSFDFLPFPCILSSSSFYPPGERCYTNLCVLLWFICLLDTVSSIILTFHIFG